MTADVVDIASRRKPSDDDEFPAGDSALCCPECMNIAWALRGDGLIECHDCRHVLNGMEWGAPS